MLSDVFVSCRRRRIPRLHVHSFGRVPPSPAPVPASGALFLFRSRQPLFRSLLDAAELRLRDPRQRSSLQPVHGRQQAGQATRRQSAVSSLGSFSLSVCSSESDLPQLFHKTTQIFLPRQLFCYPFNSRCCHQIAFRSERMYFTVKRQCRSSAGFISKADIFSLLILLRCRISSDKVMKWIGESNA